MRPVWEAQSQPCYQRNNATQVELLVARGLKPVESIFKELCRSKTRCFVCKLIMEEQEWMNTYKHSNLVTQLDGNFGQPTTAFDWLTDIPKPLKKEWFRSSDRKKLIRKNMWRKICLI